jgi:predicted membrane GTPase involved in stress response
MPLQMLFNTLDYDDYVGRLAIGRISTAGSGKDARRRSAAATARSTW